MANKETDIIIESNNMQIELTDFVTFWSSILGSPSSNTALVSYLNTLLATKQDLFYYIVTTEADKDLIEGKKTGTVVFVKATKNLYIYYNEEGSTSEWILLIRDLSSYYTKSETDALLALKANIADVYSKIEADSRFATISSLNTEANIRSQADINLQTNITAEATARTNADTNLQGQITIINNTISTYGNIVTHNTSEFATATQGALADTAIQPNDNITELNNNAGYITKAVNNLDNYMLTTDINTALGNKANSSDLTAEINNRIDADSTLQDEIDSVAEVVGTKVTKNADITGATKCKITYDSKGLVTAGTDLSASDIPSLQLSKISDVTSTAAEVNYLSGATSNIQDQINLKLNISDVINNITTTTTNQALSANMGKELQDQINNLKQRGRYLSVWNCVLGKAETTPTTNPYNLKAGDYFIVGTVASQGGTNYRPYNTIYDKDVPSTIVETGDVQVNDTYYYDGNSWSLLHTQQPTVAFGTLAGSPYDNANLTSALNAKYDASNPKGYTSNIGTITGITMNGSSKGTSGVVDLGTVITSHQDISGKENISNKVTSISSSSTNTQYPSAKCVYDYTPQITFYWGE